MKGLLFLALLFSFAFGDFFIVSGNKKVKMTPLETGKIDFSTFSQIAHIYRGNNELHAISDEAAFNHRHLNFRLATIGLTQSNYSITEWSEKTKEGADTYAINFDNYTRDDGVMLQLFYKNKWYAVILGNPLEILQAMFLKIDAQSPDLDLNKAIFALKQARTAYPSDNTFINLDNKLENIRASKTDNSAKNSTPDNKPVKVFFY